MAEERLGAARLDLTADVDPLARNLERARRDLGKTGDSMDALAEISRIAAVSLGRVRMDAGQATESKASAEGILSGVRGISDEAREAAHELDRVRITEAQAAESDAAGDVIDRKLGKVERSANAARRALDRLKLSGSFGARNGVGLGPFGSGFGRIGVLGTAVGLGALTGPALAPGAAGLLAAVGPLAAGGVGALGTLALAFDGVGKAIGGDYKAFKDLNPAAQRFVETVRSLDGWLDRLKEHAAQGIFPGLTEGLHAALSPGTVAAITRAVDEFAAAIGKAGAAWGRYFGSAEFQSIFGPLMASGARNLGKLSDAALRLFDAFGVLSRAAVPLVNWLADLADRGARFVDSWLHARDASGALARGMGEAETSLRQVGNLAGALLSVIGALGRALYPVSRVAVKDLTDGLNGLARIVKQNQNGLREFVGGALRAFVAIVKVAVPLVTALAKGLRSVAKAVGGWQIAFEALFAFAVAAKLKGILTKVVAIGDAAAGADGTGGALLKIRSLRSALEALSSLKLKAIVIPILVHEIIQKTGLGTLLAGPGLSKAGDLLPVKRAGKWVDPDTGKRLPPAGQRYWNQQELTGGLSKGQLPAATLLAGPGMHPPEVAGPAGGHPAARTPDTSVFGTPPPFTTNLPKHRKPPAPPLIPALAARAEALASANASRASVLGNVGATAKRYLENELQDLLAAAKAIRAKYVHATGRARTELFTALTHVLNEQRTVRQRIRKAIKDDRAAQLQFAVDQAKSAVAAATVGTAAYRKAVTQEERALRAQIDYLKRIVANRKLSIKVRDQAAKQEAADEKSLKALMKPINANTAANEAQFLSEFAGAVQAYAPNAVANPQGAGQASTRLYELVHETRKQTKHLQTLGKQLRFPASGYSLASATGAYG